MSKDIEPTYYYSNSGKLIYYTYNRPYPFWDIPDNTFPNKAFLGIPMGWILLSLFIAIVLFN